jgi:hypothetical protein
MRPYWLKPFRRCLKSFTSKKTEKCSLYKNSACHGSKKSVGRAFWQFLNQQNGVLTVLSHFLSKYKRQSKQKIWKIRNFILLWCYILKNTSFKKEQTTALWWEQSIKLKTCFCFVLFLLEVDGVRVSLWVAATNGSTVRSQDDTSVWRATENDPDREKWKKSEENLSQCHFARHNGLNRAQTRTIFDDFI